MGLGSFLGPIGSIVGSVIPGVGTALGGAIGAGLGALTSSKPSGSSLPFFGSNDEYGSSSDFDLSGMLSGAGAFLGGLGKDVFSGASGALPYYLSYQGQKETNAQNLAEAARNRDFQQSMFGQQAERNAYFQDHQLQTQGNWFAQQMAFNDAQASKQMDFQERMRRTQWQTSVEDMKAAGLSPMLAYSQGSAGSMGGASGFVGGVPGGSSASAGLPGGAQGRSENPQAAGFQSAAMMAQLGNMTAQNRLLDAQTVETLSRAGLQGQQTAHTKLDMQRLYGVIDRTLEEVHLTNAQAQLAKENITRAVRAGNYDEVRRALLELEIPEAAVKAKAIMEGVRGHYVPYLSDVERILGSGANAARIFHFMGR